MTVFQLVALFVCLVAAGGWLNARTLKLPHGVAMLLIGAAGAVALGTLRVLAPGLGGVRALMSAVAGIDFPQAVLT